MRLFVAVEIDPGIAQALARAGSELRQRIEQRARRARLTWIPADRLHFTVRFVGEVDEAGAASIAAVLTPPLAVAPFDLAIGAIGVFPHGGPPRVIWVGVEEGRERMIAIEREVTARLASCGIPPEGREYSPHLTLARVREAGGLRARDVLELADHEGPRRGQSGEEGRRRSRVDAITLFQSRLSPKGPSYTRLLSTRLR
jgi:2'-5' RNA ligase